MLKYSILTHDNFLKRGGLVMIGATSEGKEIIEHLFFKCSLAKLACQIMMWAFNLIRPPHNVDDLVGEWALIFPLNLRPWW